MAASVSAADPLPAEEETGGKSLDTEPVTLCSLPAPWLQQLVEALDPQACLQLFQAWSAIRDLMLSQRGVRLRCQLPILPTRERKARATLHRACTLSPSLKLAFALVSNKPEEYRTGDRVLAQLSLHSFLPKVAEGLGGSLTAVKSVELEDLYVDGLVPSLPDLAILCPNMTSLELRSCRIRPLPDEINPAWGQVQKLVVRFPVMDEEEVENELEKEQWLLQLRALTGLKSLSLDCAGEDAPASFLDNCATAFGSQLTYLRFPNLFYEGLLRPTFPTWFPNVCDLHMGRSEIQAGKTLDNADVELLLGLPCLRRLQCEGIELDEEFTTERPCPWTDLTLGTLSIESYAWLTAAGVLNNLQSLTITGPTATIYIDSILFDNGLDETRSAVQAIGRIGGSKGLQWEGVEEVQLIGRAVNAHYADNAGCLALVLPLLAGCKAHTVLIHQHRVERELVDVMREPLTQPFLKCIKYDGCISESNVWPVMVQSLPPQVDSLHLNCLEDGLITEEELTDMCVHATRYVAVHVPQPMHTGWPRGWEERVQEAMEAHGHQFVRLE